MKTGLAGLFTLALIAVAPCAMAASERALDTDASRVRAPDIQAAADAQSQTARMSALATMLSQPSASQLTEDDLADLADLAGGSNVADADLAVGRLGCEGARAAFALPVLHARLSQSLVQSPLVSETGVPPDTLRAAIWRIQTNTACDKPIPDPYHRVSPTAAG